KCYAEHITSHGFDADYFRKKPVDTDVDYIQMRIRQTHDIWHVMTGFGVGSFGELGLKAFELSQTGRPMAAVICTGGVLRYMLKMPDQLEPMMAYVAYGYNLGARAKPFLAERWEEGWDVPLDEWRTRVGWVAPEDTPYTLGEDPDRSNFE
ncbi:MAG: Coq4 family protein, partial [Planctomycetota bacterium]